MDVGVRAPAATSAGVWFAKIYGLGLIRPRSQELPSAESVMLCSGNKRFTLRAVRSSALRLVGISRDVTSTYRRQIVIVCFRSGSGQNLMAPPPSALPMPLLIGIWRPSERF